MLYETLLGLCERKGVTGYRMCADLGISKSLMTDLKMGRKKTVNAETANKIANYFNVSVDYLLGDKEKKPAIRDDEPDDEMRDILEEVRRNPDLKALFSISKKATPEDIRKTIAIMKTLKGENDEGSNY